MPDFNPKNTLENALKRSRSGEISMSELFHLLVQSDLFVPSVNAVMPDGSGFEPLLFDREGIPMIACFTAIERIGEFAKRAPYCLTMRGRIFFKRIPASYGIVLNPGESLGFDITPDGIKRISKQFV